MSAQGLNHARNGKVSSCMTACLMRSQAETQIIVEYIPGIFRIGAQYQKNHLDRSVFSDKI
ncbi:MAG: hypothetical protein C4538_13410 [Nitrospiraceae bacterium]|nr:MAG: hypothetical protein C4538_13410 [Nitrospiraceae bacterium]